MKLSELVAFKTSLDQYDFVRTSQTLIKKINESQSDISKVAGNENDMLIRFGVGVYLDQLTQDLKDLELTIADLQNNYDYYQTQIDQLILDQEQEYIVRSKKLYERQIIGEGIDSIQRRKLELGSEQKKQFISRINLYSDWRWPGLIIRPQDQDIVEAMCALDPLYLCDYFQPLLDPHVKKFNIAYQHRLRAYTIPKFLPKKRSLEQLPQTQFGFVVAYNLLDHYPLTMIQQILSEVNDLLAPGGVFLFTFNDCDYAESIQTFEQGFKSYTPFRLIKPILDSLGFRVVQKTNGEFDWCEVRKAGTLKSIRGGQALARVLNNENAVVEKERTYTLEEQEAIYRDAIALGIDSEEKIRGQSRSLGKLELLINRRQAQLQQERLQEPNDQKLVE